MPAIYGDKSVLLLKILFFHFTRQCGDTFEVQWAISQTFMSNLFTVLHTEN